MKNFKSYLFISALIVLMAGCSEKSAEPVIQEPASKESSSVDVSTEDSSSDAVSESVTSVSESDMEPKETKEEIDDKSVPEDSQIDTSVFVYAQDIKVTDALDITNHIDVAVYMSEDVGKGLAVQHVFTQTYDFLQQDKVKEAKTVTIGIMSGDFRITQITVDMGKFEAGEHFIHSVMGASKIDKMDDDVREYGESLELW
ncbi:hypothetical protein [Paenibacillus sp. QZ-Y1]|uniref:hypothetical protein n=1 Tax=Paenibacillus sp. QZ-Y1 TaxID=3414511 RepID=UPI003F7A9FB7